MPDGPVAPRVKPPTQSPLVDMAGFSALVPVVRTIDGVAWIAFDIGDLSDERYQPLAPVRAGQGECATHTNGQVWTFPSEPPMRLHLGAEGAVIEAFDGACWRSAIAPSTLTAGKTLSARGSTREPLSLALGGLDPRLDTITLHGDDVALTLRGADPLSEMFEDAMMPDWAPESPTDYEQTFEHERAFTVTALLGADGRVVALEVKAHEIADGDAGWQGGSHHHIRDTQWRVRLDRLETLDFVSHSSASYSGDGASGTDYASVRRKKLSLPRVAIVGAWRTTNSDKSFSSEADWTLELSDTAAIEVGLPLGDGLRADDRAESTVTREQLTRDLVVIADGKALRVERRDLAPAVVPLLEPPHTDRDSIVLGVAKTDDGLAYIVRAAAYRKVDPDLGPQYGEYGEEITIEDQRFVLLYISTRTLQVVLYRPDGPVGL